MQQNTGNVDRGIRLIVAVVAIYLGVTTTGGWASILLYVVAAIMALTAITGFCPLYKLLGISTKKQETKISV